VVIQGTLNAAQIQAEMERLVPGKGKWMVEEITPNTFKTAFPSKNELQRMTEWGVVQSKDRKAVMLIEEEAGGSFFKQALKRVWVQMISLPKELRDYPTIWAIGTILGVTKEVDMKSTRSMERPRFQVLVLDLDLISHSIDVVIGDFIYDLHFKVEPGGVQERGELLQMDVMDNLGGEGEGKENFHESSNIHIDHAGTGQRDGESGSHSSQQTGKTEGQVSKRPLFQLQAPVGAAPMQNETAVITEIEPDEGGVEHPDLERVAEPSARQHAADLVAGHKEELAERTAPDRVKVFAAVPEASPPSRPSKRRAENADQTNLERAEKLKATRNLDISFNKGTTDSFGISFLQFTKENVVDNLVSVDINLGNGETKVDKAVASIKSREFDRHTEKLSIDEVSKNFDQEEKEMAEEEVDKMILNSLCSEIMDKVMNLDSAYPLDCKTIPKEKSPNRSQKGKRLDKRNKHSFFQNEMDF
jgi:hypothetical protein